MNLGQAARDLVYLISCEDCKHKAQVDLKLMAAHFGEDAPLDKLKPSLRCSKCGSKRAISTKLWKSATATEGYVKSFLAQRSDRKV